MRKCKGKVNVYSNGKWTTESFELGYFHVWGCHYEEFESGAGNYSVAIVELPDGSVIMPVASNIQFLDTLNSNNMNTNINGYKVGDILIESEDNSEYVIMMINIELIEGIEEITYFMKCMDSRDNILDGFGLDDLNNMILKS